MVAWRDRFRLAQEVERLGEPAGRLQRRGHLHQHVEGARVGRKRAPGEKLAPRQVAAAARERRVLQQELRVV